MSFSFRRLKKIGLGLSFVWLNASNYRRSKIFSRKIVCYEKIVQSNFSSLIYQRPFSTERDADFFRQRKLIDPSHWFFLDKRKRWELKVKKMFLLDRRLLFFTAFAAEFLFLSTTVADDVISTKNVALQTTNAEEKKFWKFSLFFFRAEENFKFEPFFRLCQRFVFAKMNFPLKNISTMFAKTFVFDRVDMFDRLTRVVKIVFEARRILIFLFSSSTVVSSLTRHLKKFDNQRQHEEIQSSLFETFRFVKREKTKFLWVQPSLLSSSTR